MRNFHNLKNIILICGGEKKNSHQEGTIANAQLDDNIGLIKPRSFFQGHCTP